MDQQNSQLYYQHSGKMGVGAIVSMLALGGGTALIGGVIYAYAIYYIPLIYISFLLTIGYGFIIGAALGKGAMMGKARNTKLVVGISLAVGLFAVYVQWVAWLFAATEQEILAIHPVGLFEIITTLAEEGVWSIFDSTPTGFMLYAVWGIEAAIIAGMSVLAPSGMVGDTPFCERCQKWIEGGINIQPFFDPEDNQMVKTRLEQGDFDAIDELAVHDTGQLENVFSRVELRRCESCQDQNLLSFQSVTLKTDSDGDVSEDTQDIVKFLRVDAATYDRFVSDIPSMDEEQDWDEEEGEEEA